MTNITAGTYTGSTLLSVSTNFASQSINVTRNCLAIGMDRWQTATSAKIADFRVYNRALSATEALSIYNQGPQ